MIMLKLKTFSMSIKLDFHARFTVCMKLAHNFIVQFVQETCMTQRKNIENIFYVVISWQISMMNKKMKGERSTLFSDISLASGMLYHSRLSNCPLLQILFHFMRHKF